MRREFDKKKPKARKVLKKYEKVRFSRLARRRTRLDVEAEKKEDES